MHGSQKHIHQVLERVGYRIPNTSSIELRNGTVRLISAAQVRRTLTFAGDAYHSYFQLVDGNSL